ncbi:MAG: hypothetical protein QNJ49_00400 [Mastigocoleus sp. MO_167.B18]|uniref:hypothetical protein n=1 Tax=Mastigocoleus sp. MO_188.B34 TaxID=3036635 RepID=UPI0026239613|nr:hypothetical protein [Mastigocoleus sp. MO_188.B34]MDJ0692914.1 hypothetical protein [Mastigocoleus sp. MO_188.B34]MDJ0771879.1 hypothetical protein [Mastigocoleus sp. MO_167.B18]
MKSTTSFLISLGIAVSAVVGTSFSVLASQPYQQKSTVSTQSYQSTTNTQTSNTQTSSTKVSSKQVAQIFGGSQQSKRPGDNYIGLGSIIGGDTDFVDAAIISKVKLLNLGSSKSISVRPSAVFSNGDLDVRIPATLDWTKINRDLGEFNGRVTPYAGGGVAIDSGGDADLMLTAGVDVQLTPRFTGTAAANVLFLGETEFDTTVGVGYNF